MRLIILVAILLIFPIYAYADSQIVSSENGILDLRISTEPISPKPGEITKLKIDFLNPSLEKIQEHIDYTLVVSDDVSDVFGPISLTHTSSGAVVFPIEFPKDGLYVGRVEIQGILFSPIPNEIAIFEIQIGESTDLMSDDMSSFDDPDMAPSVDSPNQVVDSGGCLIATAAMGTEMTMQVQNLREVRDVITSTQYGNQFMMWFNQVYYTFSPVIADAQRENRILQTLTQIIITPMIYSLIPLEYIDGNSEQQVLLVGIGIILLNIGMYIILPSLVVKSLVRTRKVRI